MMKHRTHLRRIKRIKPDPVLLIILAGVAGYVVVFAMITVFSALSSRASPDDDLMSVFTALALFAGAYAGGYISAKNRHKNGLLMGVCCGLFMFLIILIVGTVISHHTNGFGAPVKFLITVVAGGVGGLIGVNSTTFR
ncbi:TIGR04086 family membrane protein [Ruminococcus sp. NK3A76]|uniref:TIGR04086 family membrane protein n=1 Tax=Ruminococcus sp. NK3A76 TaxID=877411 RepID=UPI00068B221F|nr:TIGR04086 family membrane protein [Ruminococcus sp. NK3A76]